MDTSMIESWVSHSRNIQDILQLLRKLQILKFENHRFLISPKYQQSLHNALVGGGDPASFGRLADNEDKNQVTQEFLDKYSLDAWENVLHYLVGTSFSKRPPAIVQLLEKSGLMVKSYLWINKSRRFENY